MAEKLDPKELVSFKELLMSEVIQSEALFNVLEKKGIITKQELLEEIKRVQASLIKAKKIFVAIIIIMGLFVVPQIASAQTDRQRSQNLATCLSGKYPILCKHEWLTQQERKKVEEAEHRENFNTCLSGRYPSLCRKDKLTPAEKKQIFAAEKRENLKTCLTGRYKSLCKRDLLTKSELKQVLATEREENFRVCMTGLYPSLCDHSLLSSEQLSQAKAAERRVSKSHPQPAPGNHPVVRRSPAADYEYEVEGYGDSGYVYGEIEANRGSRDVEGYIYDENGNEKYFEGEWTGKGEIEGYDEEGNYYELEVE